MNDRRQQLIDKHSAKSGMRGKVNAMCISCIFDEFARQGTWRQQVAACSCSDCPLYSIRPVSSGISNGDLQD